MSRIIRRTVFQPIASVITHEDGSQTLEVDWTDSLLWAEDAEGNRNTDAQAPEAEEDGYTLDRFLALVRHAAAGIERARIPADL